MSSTFPHTHGSRRGYDVDQVEEFLEDARKAYATDPSYPTGISSGDIRRTAFDLVKGGYSPAHVDAALERLEDAFARRERQGAFASARGEEEWYREARSTAQTVIDRLDRPKGHRFARTGPFTRGYSIKEVDAFAARLSAYFEKGEALSVEDVRTAAFREHSRGYDEAQVDYLLETVTRIMVAVA